MRPKNGPKIIKNRSKNCPKSIQNGSEIDAKMMIGSKIAFWRHLGRLGSHLGAQKGGRRIPRREQRAEPTPLGRGGKGKPLLGRDWKGKGVWNLGVYTPY